MSRIALDLRGDREIEVSPCGYLGLQFDFYRTAVGKVCRYDRKTKMSVCALGRYAELRAVLEEYGFEVRLEKALARLVGGVESERAAWAAGLAGTVAVLEARRPLYPFQREGVAFLGARTRALLADEPGLGKTGQVLAALPALSRTVVVCPAVARMVWVEETEKLRPDLRVRRVTESGFASPQPGEIVVAGYEDVAMRLLPRQIPGAGALCGGGRHWKTTCVLSSQRCDRSWMPLLKSIRDGLPVSKDSEEFSLRDGLMVAGMVLLSGREGGIDLLDAALEELRDDEETPAELRVPILQLLGKLVGYAIRRCEVPDKAACGASFAVCEDLLPPVPDCTHLVTDEAHYLKGKRSQRAQAHARLEEKTRVAWHLTGTPLPNKAQELWNVLDSAGLAREAFGTFDVFVGLFGGTFEEIYLKGGKKRRVVQFPDLRGLEAVAVDEMSDEIRMCLARVMLRRKKSVVLPELPDKTFRTIKVDVSEEMMTECEAARRKFMAMGIDVDGLVDHEKIPFHEIAPLRKKLAIAKTPSAVELVESYELAGRPIVVFSAHEHPATTLGKRKGWAKIDGTVSEKKRKAAKDAFQRGELKGIAATIKAAGTALTLTAASDILFVDWDWVPANNEQAIDRVHRIGQDRGVIVTSLVSEHPLDARVSEVISIKMATIRAAMG